ncbi:MAG: GNAT family N-acetyltransferase [Bacteroidia bacterium]|nr:GNAT family N-acetyltransferase [Bacteroidia bacterium]
MKVGAATQSDLPQILNLQRQNLPGVLCQEEMNREGFVTVEHDLEVLSAMNLKHPHTVAKVEDQVIGYALAMHTSFMDHVDILKPMFTKIEQVLKFIDPDDPLNYIVMGQICIAKGYRGQGLFTLLYNDLKQRLSDQYEQIITEVDMKNTRSIAAHHKHGFEIIHTYEQGTITWQLLSWKWQ